MENDVSNRGWLREHLLPVIAVVAVLVVVGMIYRDYRSRVPDLSYFNYETSLPEPAAAGAVLISTDGWPQADAAFQPNIPYSSELTPHEFSAYEFGFSRGPAKERGNYPLAEVLFTIQGQTPEALKSRVIREQLKSLDSETVERFGSTDVLHFSGHTFDDDVLRPNAENGYLIFPKNEMQSITVSYYVEDPLAGDWARSMVAAILNR